MILKVFSNLNNSMILWAVKFGADTVPEMTGKIPSGYLRVPVCSESDSAALGNEYHKYWKKKERGEKHLFLVVFEHEVPIRPAQKSTNSITCFWNRT